MKKAPRGRRTRPASESMRREYAFDYGKAKPNRFARKMSAKAVMVVLDPDVARVFGSSESVNTLLRSVISAIPRQRRAKAQ